MAVYKAATSYKNPKRPDLPGFGYLAILKKLREQDPDLADEIERRGDQIYDSYDETERYRRKDSVGNKEPLTAIARAQEQAVNEYVERFPDIASFLQPETFREKDQRYGTTSEVADREISMFRRTPKTEEKDEEEVTEKPNFLKGSITPVFSSTSSMSGNKAVASVEEDEDTAIIDEEDEEDDVYGSLSLNQIIEGVDTPSESKSAPVKDEDNIIVASDPTEESIVIEEDEEEVTDEDVDDIVSELNTIEGGRPSDSLI
jgi:hypothetical protein